jgi:amidophosphoribosyltransferase
MCGILGIVGKSPVGHVLYDGLQMLQHRGQDAAGIATMNNNHFHLHKGSGMVRDVFRTRDMRELVGNIGIAHVRYPTAGSASNASEAQPFYVNSPFGIVLAHNGNLTNTDALKADLFALDRRHINTQSDSEVLLNIFAHELSLSAGYTLNAELIFSAVGRLHSRIQGAYAVVAMIAGYGVVGFRDPDGIRPLVIGKNDNGEWMLASESVALDGAGFKIVRDVAPGEAVFINEAGDFFAQQITHKKTHFPCLFEFVYFARPDSVMEGVSVYQARTLMGKALAEKIARDYADLAIDVVMPIPDTSRPSALELASQLGIPYREGFIKNRYIGRTFIMPGQAVRKKSVRQKLSPVPFEFEGKNVLLVDDSIVRGTTSQEIVQMAREAGAKKVYFASAAPAVRYPNVYGIDMPTREELLATGRDDAAIARQIGADKIIYQDLEDLKASITSLNPALTAFETSCFDGIYIAGEITEPYLLALEQHQTKAKKALAKASLD